MSEIRDYTRLKNALKIVLMCFAAVPAIAAPQWRLATFPSIVNHAAAYDESHSQLVVFGGWYAAYADAMNTTWIFSGSSWEQRFPNTRPSARVWHSMVYDAARKTVVLFGGYGDEGRLDDTWVWNGSDWVKQTTMVRPPARRKHVLAYDAKRKVVVLFGGDDLGNLDDTWTWDGSTWTLRTPKSRPPARANHAMAWDESLGAIVLFGGLGESGDLADTWLWDGNDWTQSSATGPCARWEHVLVSDAAGSRVVLFGGYSDETLEDTWIWRAGAWTRYDPPSGSVRPTARSSHAAAYDSVRKQAVIVGGENESPLDDTWGFGASGWTLLAPSANPTPRTAQAIVYDATRREVVLFGGSRNGDLSSETWTWNGTQWTLRTPTVTPSPMACHSMAFDAMRQEVVLFGGDKGETWTWNGTTWARRQSSVSPPPLYWHTMAYDAARDRIVLFGGRKVSTWELSGETWTWDGAKWQRMNPPASPSARAFHAMAYDADRRAVVLYGGSKSNDEALADTWIWNGVNWVQQSAAASPPRMDNCSLVYDSGSRMIILQGRSSYGGSSRSETWIWNGTTWSAVYSKDVPPLRCSYPLAYDDERHQLLLYGGREGGGNGALGDTWIWKEWQSPPSEGPSLASVVNAASFVPGVVDGSWLSILGANLSSTSRTWRADEIVNGSLPTSLDGVRVLIDGLPAAISYISPTQLNVQAPITGKAGDVVDVVITNSQGGNASTRAEVKAVSPGIFVYVQGGGQYPAALVTRADGKVDYLGPAGLFGSALASRPAKPGEIISLYATGLGPTNPLVPAGQVFSGSAPLSSPVVCEIDYHDVPVSYAGMVGVGLYQLNIKVPNVTAAGNKKVYCQVNGVLHQRELQVAIEEQGRNGRQ